MKLAAPRRITGIIALLALSVALSACAPDDGEAGQGSSQLVDTGQSSAEAQESEGSTQARPSSGEGAAQTRAEGSTSGGASGSDATLGDLRITVSVSQARRMAPAASAQSAPPTQGQPGQQDQQGPEDQEVLGQSAPAQQELVLGDRMLHVTKNLDASQAPPPDPEDGRGDVVRHVSVQVKDESTGQVVPYLEVTMDILRDGRPIQYDQPLVPMVPAGGGPDQLSYGNNVAFPEKGRYQLFVRMPDNPMLGSEAPPYAQFDLTIE